MSGQGNEWVTWRLYGIFLCLLFLCPPIPLPFIPLPSHSLARPFRAPVPTTSSTHHVYPSVQIPDNVGCLGTSTKRAARWTAPPFSVASIAEVDHVCIVF
jgi:hypothetical protein